MRSHDLQDFLLKCHQSGYATGNYNAWKKEEDGSTTIVFTEGSWRMQDNFLGGEPYGGREVVWYKNSPAWIMVYYGRVGKDYGKQREKIYRFLQHALRHPPDMMPLRGPKSYTDDPLHYQNFWRGTIEQFQGSKKIYFGKKKVYDAHFLGGLVNVFPD